MELPEPLLRQFSSFLLFALGGVALGFAFDVLRAFRLILKPRGLSSFLLDLVYWLAALVVVFPLLTAGTWGDLRLFFWIALFLGAVYYFYLLRGPGRLLADRLARPIVILLRLPGHAWYGAKFVRAEMLRKHRSGKTH